MEIEIEEPKPIKQKKYTYDECVKCKDGTVFIFTNYCNPTYFFIVSNGQLLIMDKKDNIPYLASGWETYYFVKFDKPITFIIKLNQ